MEGISAISGGVSNLQLQSEYSMRVAKLAKDAVDMQGDMALKLIQSASSAVGGNLNISV